MSIQLSKITSEKSKQVVWLTAKIWVITTANAEDEAPAAFPDDEDVVDAVGRRVKEWSGGKALKGIHIVKKMECLKDANHPDKPDREIRVCLLNFVNQVGKKPLNNILKFPCQGLTLGLCFVDITYENYKKWEGFKDEFDKYQEGIVKYFEETYGGFFFKPEGYQSALDEMVKTTSDSGIATLIMDNCSEKEALKFGGQMINNVKALQKALNQESPKPIQPPKNEIEILKKKVEDLEKTILQLKREHDNKILDLTRRLEEIENKEKIKSQNNPLQDQSLFKSSHNLAQHLQDPLQFNQNSLPNHQKPPQSYKNASQDLHNLPHNLQGSLQFRQNPFQSPQNLPQSHKHPFESSQNPPQHLQPKKKSNRFYIDDETFDELYNQKPNEQIPQEFNLDSGQKKVLLNSNVPMTSSTKKGNKFFM